MRLLVQLELALPWREANRTNQVYSLIVREAGASSRCLPPRRPRPLQGRDQGKARFIDKNEGGLAFTTVFLSWATHTASSERRLPRRASGRDVAVSGNSSRVVASNTRRCSNDSVRGTSARSGERSDRASSNLPHSPRRRLRAPMRQPIVVVGRPTSGWDGRVDARDACAWDAWTHGATDKHSAEWLQPVSQFPQGPFLGATCPTRVDAGEQVVLMFHRVACAQYSTRTDAMNFSY